MGKRTVERMAMRKEKNKIRFKLKGNEQEHINKEI
jgi:hypothetical protein